MRPITDDVVLSLMKGLEKREKRALARRMAAKAAIKPSSGMTGRIFGFANAKRKATSPLPKPGRVSSLTDAAQRRRKSRASKGMFSYTSFN